MTSQKLIGRDAHAEGTFKLCRQVQSDCVICDGFALSLITFEGDHHFDTDVSIEADDALRSGPDNRSALLSGYIGVSQVS